MIKLRKLLRSKYKFVIITVVVVILLLFVQKSRSNSEHKVETARVKQGNLKEELVLSGEINASEKATLRFQTSGRLAYIAVHEGQWVKKGQVIARLDSRELQKKLNKDLNLFLSKRYSFDQTKDDNKDKAITDAIKRVIDTSQNDLNNTVIDVELQKIALDFSTLTTPISGIVTSVATKVAGVNITPAQAEFEIINPETIFFTATADQTEVTKLKEGMGVALSLDAFPDNPLDGEIKTIAYTPKSGETGTVYEFTVNLTSSRIENPLRIGMTGDATITTEEKKNVLYLPIKYVKLDKSKPYVFITKDKKITKKTVTTGLETENRIEILSGLKNKDLVYDQAQ